MWRYHIQSQYRRAREAVNEKLREAIRARADQHNANIRPHKIEEGVQVWLYLDRVKEGYARKLAHMWHGPFRVIEMIVHLPKLKPVRVFPDRPTTALTITEDDRIDFDEALLPEDSWESPLESDEEFKVFWKGYDDPSWVDEADLNCGALLHEYERRRTSRNRFHAMQTHEEEGNDP
ncbi:Reverse transcriptase [Phytophthora palmivora]|uniref:Reverse transcriptase n=1 Tax=Phytophthora palmivora TaxID=4796 RepID=A0A2P4Y2X6_9STRA|nr:Reverse transcriptase [Phytophthora palmivora]